MFAQAPLDPFSVVADDFRKASADRPQAGETDSDCLLLHLRLVCLVIHYPDP
jgi:hypothetical protein